MLLKVRTIFFVESNHSKVIIKLRQVFTCEATEQLYVLAIKGSYFRGIYTRIHREVKSYLDFARSASI